MSKSCSPVLGRNFVLLYEWPEKISEWCATTGWRSAPPGGALVGCQWSPQTRPALFADRAGRLMPVQRPSDQFNGDSLSCATGPGGDDESADSGLAQPAGGVAARE